ncbi:MAG: RDD family protein [Planctomycetes bacterium]|nr:RDD family protein [Planctomycetota bacterium]
MRDDGESSAAEADGRPSEVNPYAAPQSIVRSRWAYVGRVVGRPASRWIRLGAALLDGVIAMALWLPLALALGLFDFVQPRTDLDTQLRGFLLGLALFLAVNGYLLFARGQTVGKFLCGTRIVRVSGQRISGWGILLRRVLPMWLVQYVPVVGWMIALLNCLLIFRASRRCLHDEIAGTIVVYAARPGAAVPRPPTPP